MLAVFAAIAVILIAQIQQVRSNGVGSGEQAVLERAKAGINHLTSSLTEGADLADNAQDVAPSNSSWDGFKKVKDNVEGLGAI